MQYIPYDPRADVWYQFGNALGTGLSTLATNRDMRGAAKQYEYDEANRRQKEYSDMAGQLQQLGELYSDPEKIKEQIGFSRLALAGKLGGQYVPDNVEAINNMAQQWYDRANKMGQFQGMNQGKYYNNGFTHLLDWDK